jgi:hypothetical protein
MSLLVATFWIPIALAKLPSIDASVRALQRRFAIYCVLYVLAVTYLIPRL